MITGPRGDARPTLPNKSTTSAQTSMRAPIVTVRLSGSAKYSTGLAALWAIARNSFLRQVLIPGASVAGDGDLREEVGRVIEVDTWVDEFLRGGQLERGGHVCPVLEAVAGGEQGDAVCGGHCCIKPIGTRVGRKISGR